MEPSKQQPSANVGMSKVAQSSNENQQQRQSQAQGEEVSRLRGGGCCAWLTCGLCTCACWEICCD
ncbi:hypothetical protein L486_07671 [Kwoniella mangroviensis CBS 10435]|uniref:Uncharacterized protein n=1 Tax=Kwoniella mangroviensis CBS 10435 TaxID=1331196 RepID=A0A1B9IHK7_9TREE|nr:hypothetical protein L486_07671 [Kwoniella mangroviensis CBS 10435]OCF73036.1 hypothetical protein I204_06266 [Kwoniella mangroviensis CBS 8886]